MKTRLTVFTLVVCLMMSPVVMGEDQEFVMDAQKCVEFTRWLEQHPFHEKAQPVSAILLKYISDTPDFTVSLCSEFIGDLLGSEETGNAELLAQYMFGMGAFCCEHPDMKDAEVEKQRAGVQSMMVAYGVMKKANPNIKIKFMEKLMKLNEKGKLEAFVEKQTKKCLK